MSTQQQLDHLRSLLPASEVIERDAPGYKDQSAPWSVWADQRPPLVLQPTTLESMSKVVKYLYDSDLDFAVRNTGTGSVSAKDVILSTHGFKDFKFDEASETVTLGSGFCWGEVDQLMEKHAFGYQVVGARCSWVGVTGSALVGGLSWLSHEYGMISDPQNLLDMQIVLADGKNLLRLAIISMFPSEIVGAWRRSTARRLVSAIVQGLDLSEALANVTSAF